MMTSHATACDYLLNETTGTKTFTIMKGSGAHCWLRRLSRYRSCSCFHPRMGCDIDLYFCFASLRAAYSSMESLVSFACARFASIHRRGEYLSPYACSNFSLAAASYPDRIACRASYNSTGSSPVDCAFTPAYYCNTVSSSTEYFCSCASSFCRLASSAEISLRKVSASASSA